MHLFIGTALPQLLNIQAYKHTATAILGHYKVEIYSDDISDFLPTPIGHGMLVEVSDPEGLLIMSRVRQLL